MRRIGAVAVGLVMALGVAATITSCGPSGPGDDRALPAGVTVEVVQLRSDVVDRAAQVRLRNEGDVDLVVTGLEVVDSRFARPIVREASARVAAGRTVDLRIDLPPVACAARSAGAGSRMQLRYEAGGTQATAEAPLPDPLAFIPLLHEKECLRESLAEVAVLSWAAFEASAAPAPARLTLDIAPSGGAGTAHIATVGTTPLLMFDSGGAAFSIAAEVAGSGSPQSIGVPLVPLRCDPHAVMEDKRGTVFDVTVEIEGVAGVVEVAAPAVVKGQILNWVAAWCGFG